MENWLYTATFLTHLIITTLMESTQLCGAAAGRRQPPPVWEKRWQTDPSTLNRCCFLLSIKEDSLPPQVPI